MSKIATAGNAGDKVRSDCLISLELTESGGIDISLKSKVNVMYGEEIRSLCKDMLSFFGVGHAKLTVEDTGSLNFVIAARLEAAIMQLMTTEKEYLLSVIEENTTVTSREQFRFSRLYLPGNMPSMMLNAGIHKPNGIILDLEDAVAPAKKTEAKYLVRNALRQVNFYGAERMVRINQLPRGLEDLKFAVPHHVNLLLIPMPQRL
ncbi:MAG: hypothetical protein KJ607_07735 [Bacteroidetes bacterium]|nr:hypothetical protein [Bacteroidota bacterium]